MADSDVILVGASVRSMAESALRDGLRPVCVDMFADADLQLLMQQQATFASERVYRIDAFSEVPELLSGLPPEIPVVFSGGFENSHKAYREVAKNRPVTGSALATLKAVTDPGELFPKLKRLGCRVPDWSINEPGDTTRPWLEKSVISSGGRGIIEVSRSGHRSDNARSANGRTYFQERIDGVPISASFLAEQPASAGTTNPRRAVSARLLGVALQLSGLNELHAPSFQFCGNVAPICLPAELRLRIHAVGNAVTDAWNVKGVFGVDMIVRDGQPYVLEVNPRLTASHELHEWFAPDKPGHVTLQMQTVQSTENPVARSRHKPTQNQTHVHQRSPWVRLVLYSDSDLTVAPDLHRSIMQCTGAAVAARLADIPPSGSSVAVGAPFCSVYFPLHTSEDIESRLGEKLSPLMPDIACRVASVRQRIQELSKTLQMDLKSPKSFRNVPGQRGHFC